MARLKSAVGVRPKMSATAGTAKTSASRRVPAAGRANRHPPEPPKGGRSLATYDKLIRAAGELLGEIGFEKLTTNAVCARAGLTPPALYHYFQDKYELLEALARKLLEKQTEAFAAWASQGSRWKDPGGRAALEEWFRTSIELTLSEPGAIWTLRALRALPNLAHIRLESQRKVTDTMFHHFRPLYPSVPSAALWCRLRIIAEFGFNVDELALEEHRIPHDVLFREAARVLAIPYGREK
jgi:AcrR family transcriptional regulator